MTNDTTVMLAWINLGVVAAFIVVGVPLLLRSISRRYEAALRETASAVRELTSTLQATKDAADEAARNFRQLVITGSVQREEFDAFHNLVRSELERLSKRG